MEFKKISTVSLIVINVLVVLGLWTTGALSLLNPVTWRCLALCGYVFPVFLVATLAMLLLCVIMGRWRLLLIPVIGLAVAYMPVTLYCPLHMKSDVPDKAIQVMTFNTENWGHSYEGEVDRQELHHELLQYIADCLPDIVCIQEGNIGGAIQQAIDSIIRPEMQYIDTVKCPNKAIVVIFSRYPITKKEAINYESNGNGSAAFWLTIDGRQVIVINNHLQTMGLSLEDRENFREMVHGEQESDSIEQTSQTIFGKILEASCKRAPQAGAVAQFIRLHKDTPIIVCGDFNDIPLSYTHRTIAHDLTDCYQATALGPGYTLTHYGMRVRIDNILCSDDFTPYNCFVDKSIALSDHYPMRCWFTFK